MNATNSLLPFHLVSENAILACQTLESQHPDPLYLLTAILVLSENFSRIFGLDLPSYVHFQDSVISVMQIFTIECGVHPEHEVPYS